MILLGMSGRLATRGAWWRWGRVHAVVALGLLPLTLAFFGENPWLSPLANLVAVPWMGIFVVPLVLSGILLSLPFPTLGEWLLLGAATAVEWLWPMLAWLAERDLVYRAPAGGELWLVLAAGHRTTAAAAEQIDPVPLADLVVAGRISRALAGATVDIAPAVARSRPARAGRAAGNPAGRWPGSGDSGAHQ